jgi:hypothetical protein
MIGFSYMIHDIAKKGDEFFDIMCRLWYPFSCQQERT